MSTVRVPVAHDRDARPAGRRGAGVRARVLALSADHVAVLALATVAVLLAAITWNRWGDPSYDTGLDLVAGAKVSHADLPYLDFTYWYGPLGPMLLGVVFEVAGIAVGPAVALGLVLAAACIGLTYAVGRLLLPPLPAALAAALAAVPALSSTNISYVQPHTLDAPLGVLLALVAVLAAARYATTGARRWVAATGACLGLCLLTKPENAIALGLALGGWLAVRAVLADPAPPTARPRAAARSATSGWPSGPRCSSGWAATRPSSSRAPSSTTRSRSVRSSTRTSSRPGSCASRCPSSTTCWRRARPGASPRSRPSSRSTWPAPRRSSRSA